MQRAPDDSPPALGIHMPCDRWRVRIQLHDGIDPWAGLIKQMDSPEIVVQQFNRAEITAFHPRLQFEDGDLVEAAGSRGNGRSVNGSGGWKS